MMGKAYAPGAISIVNAIAAGLGSTVGIRLLTRSEVRLEPSSGGWAVSLNGRSGRYPLALETVRRALRLGGKDPDRYSGSISTTTQVPVGVGLKTSSSSAVAITLATLAALGERAVDPSSVLRSCVSASLASGTSLTGAIDDAGSSLFGGLVFSDNLRKRIVHRATLGESFTVLVRVPPQRSRRRAVEVQSVKAYAAEARRIFRIGRDVSPWRAMTLNGLLYSSIYGYDPGPAVAALEAGALGAGLSGTGPATAAVFGAEGEPEKLAKLWRSDGAGVLRTTTTDRGARID